MAVKNQPWSGLIRAYRDYLPIQDERHIISLNEGNTPLIEAPRLAHQVKFPGKLFLKCEGQNPTGSFKDRGMTYAVSQAMAQGAQALICASTGNTAASAAAYAARAGIKSFVLIPEGQVALGKLSQAAMHGARIIKVRGNFDAALRLVQEIVKKHAITLVNSVNPYRIQGQRTAAFEICDALGEAPTYHALPVGNAGNITAYWQGYVAYQKAGKVKRLPRMLGFQAEGAAPIVRDRVIEEPETIATAIRIGNPASWKSAKQVLAESKGSIDMVSDQEILEAYDWIARLEGIFCEPASAAGIAGIRKICAQGLFKTDDLLVCTLTGHGLKDPQTALSRDFEQDECDASLKDLLQLIGDDVKG